MLNRFTLVCQIVLIKIFCANDKKNYIDKKKFQILQGGVNDSDNHNMYFLYFKLFKQQIYMQAQTKENKKYCSLDKEYRKIKKRWKRIKPRDF